MGHLFALLYGVAAYLLFLPAFLYAIGFVTGLIVPKTIDSGPTTPVSEALIVNLLLLSLFAIQHSGMARKPFKRWLTQFVPAVVERSTYVLLATLVLILLLWQWRPMPAIVWQIADPTMAGLVLGVSLFGWFLVLFSTFLINHSELFGLSQVLFNLVGRKTPEAQFKTPVLYKVVRHPLYLGFVIAFWAAPTMTVGRLLFAAVTTAYIFVGIWLEERDLVAEFGDQYRRYRERVSMLIPFLRKWAFVYAFAVAATALALPAVAHAFNPTCPRMQVGIASQRLAGPWQVSLYDIGSCRAVLNTQGIIASATCQHRFGHAMTLSGNVAVDADCKVSGRITYAIDGTGQALDIVGAVSLPDSDTVAATIRGGWLLPQFPDTPRGPVAMMQTR